MAKAKAIMYDEENDILYIKAPGKVQDSIQIDDFILDFKDDMHIIGVEILNASKMLSKLLDIKLNKKILSSLKDARISNVKSRELMFVRVVMKFNINNKIVEKEIQPQVPIAK